MKNPIANADQFSAERDVAAMWRTDAVKRARATAGSLFELAYGMDSPQEAKPSFDSAMDEYVTNYLFKAAAADPARPRFVRNFMPAYHWDGRDVPGARMGGDNPDNVYRLAGIVHGARYRVTGKPTGPEASNTSFTLTGNWGTSVTIQTLETADLVREADGSFVISIDDQPANGRANHVTTAPHAKFLFIRESLLDWATECCYDLTIERLDGASAHAQSIEELAEHAAFRLTEEVPLYYWFQRLFAGQAPNSMRAPASSSRLGGLVTQAGSQGHVLIGADEAALVRYQPAGAKYVATELADWWFRSIDAHRRQSSLTAAQSVADPDGWITVVVAREDPGVANWLDTGGLGRVLFFTRWQGLPREAKHGGPATEIRVVKLDELPDALQRNQPIDAAARAASIAQRRAAWDRRTTADC